MEPYKRRAGRRGRRPLRIRNNGCEKACRIPRRDRWCEHPLRRLAQGGSPWTSTPTNTQQRLRKSMPDSTQGKVARKWILGLLLCVLLPRYKKHRRRQSSALLFVGVQGGAFLKKYPLAFLSQQILENSSSSQSPSKSSIIPSSQAAASLRLMGSFAVAGMPKASAVFSMLLSP